MTFSVVVGNPKAGSRTLSVALAAARALERRVAGVESPFVIDLAEVAGELFEPQSKKVIDLLATVTECDLILVASPTYKASYTGLLKSFFDRYATNALAHSVAIALMTGAAPTHALAVDVHLRPLLVELGASVPTRSLYVVEQQFDALDSVIDPWADAASPLIAGALDSRAP
jgi:FMN reductase